MSLNRISRDTNDTAGSFEVTVYMGSVEPQQKKTISKLFGVFKRAEDVKVTAEYLNPSFVEKKSNGGL